MSGVKPKKTKRLLHMMISIAVWLITLARPLLMPLLTCQALHTHHLSSRRPNTQSAESLYHSIRFDTHYHLISCPREIPSDWNQWETVSWRRQERILYSWRRHLTFTLPKEFEKSVCLFDPVALFSLRNPGSTLDLEYVQFNNCNTSIRVVKEEKGTVTLKHVTMNNCIFNESPYLCWSTVTMTDCEFKEVSVKKEYGVILLETDPDFSGQSHGLSTFTDCKFIECSCSDKEKGKGGAICAKKRYSRSHHQ